MFVGRKKEVELLSQLLNSSKQETVVIYGRRRIGKSELIKHVLEQSNLNYIYYQAKETTIEDNIESLSQLLTSKDNLIGLKFNTFEDILRYLFEKANEAPILVIDEYPYLLNLMPGLDSIIQMMIDGYKNRSRIKIVLLGSFIDVMNGLNEPNKPLYGRITQMLFIGELNYLETSYFYHQLPDTEKVMYYSVFGGVPYYNQLIDTSISFMDNVCRLIIDQKGILSDFVEFFLSRELRRINYANSVLETIALGKHRFADILGRLQKNTSSSQLANVLDLLIKMDLVSKTTPINELDNSRKTYYDIKDNYIQFYYRYIFRHLSERSILDTKTFYDEIIKDHFEKQFVPNIFERIAHQYLVIQNQNKRISPPLLKIGKYWYDDPKTKTNGEFDLVSYDKLGYIVYEVKYTNKKVNNEILLEEILQLKACNVEYYKLGFFSKSGFDIKNDDAMYLVTLEDMYKDLK